MKLQLGNNVFKLLLLGGLGRVSSVLYGDEQFGDVEGGRFWAFHSAGISIVNPESCSVVKNFGREDTDSKALPTAWYDGVYMETNSNSQEENQGYVLMNSAVTSYDDHENLEGGTGEVLVISTAVEDYDAPVKARVKVGGRPVHSYAVHTRDEFWTHSDANGLFYVINLDDVTKHTGKPIVAKVEEANHGKLLWDENEHLKSHGFATSTGERTLFYMDMDTHQLLGTYNYTQDIDLPHSSYCRGTHAIAYSSLNKHIYLECTAGGGTLEFNVEDPVNPKFVSQHKDATGSLYELPDESGVVASDKTNNKLHIFKPAGTGQKSSIDYQVNVPGHPSTPTFYPSGSSYIMCMPLTENTNLNHMDDNGNIVCDYYGCSGAKTAQDVANGICLYDKTGINLLQAKKSEMSSVESGAAPFNGACDRCKKSGNYDDDDVCVCTPNCGSCADPNYDASISGVRCLNLEDVFSGKSQTTTLVKGAGAVAQGDRYDRSPQCGFGRTYRTHKRGGKYDASVANFPVNSVQIVDMSTQTYKCQVELKGKPNRIVYVPPQKGQDEEEEKKKLSTGAIAGISVGAVFVVGLIGWKLSTRDNRE